MNHECARLAITTASLRLLALVARRSGAACGAADAHSVVARPIRDVRYRTSTFMRANAQQRRCRRHDDASTTTGAAPVILSLPAWTPGAYEISNFARWVTGFRVSGDGTRARVGQAGLRYVAHSSRWSEDGHA